MRADAVSDSTADIPIIIATETPVRTMIPDPNRPDDPNARIEVDEVLLTDGLDFATHRIRVLRAGVSGKLFQGYNVGPTTWAHAHVVLYPNGNRAMILMVADGRYRAAA